MKKFFKLLFLSCCFFFCINYAHAACTVSSQAYIACKAGYFLYEGDCLPCRDLGYIKATNNALVYGTSADNNATGPGACYIEPSTTRSFKDGVGTYQITGNCPYVI